MIDTRELLAERYDHFKAAEKLLTTAKAAGKDISGVELEQFNAAMTRIKSIDRDLDRYQNSRPAGAAPIVRDRSIPGGPRNMDDPTPLPFPGNRGQTPVDPAFEAYLRTGVMATADLSPSADPGGGVLIPTVLWETLTRRYAGFRPVESVARIIQTENGDPMNFPRIDDTVDGQYLAASASTGSAAPPTTLDKITLGAFKASSKPVAVSRELLTDANYDVGMEIIGMLGARCGRLLNDSFTNGTLATEPTGFLNGCTYPKAAGTAITLDDVLDLVYAIAAQYRKPTNVFQMSSNTQKFLRSLKTGITNDQTPLWQESPRAGEPPTLYGAPVIINDSMPDIGTAGAVVKGCVAYGDLASCFLVRKAGPAFILRYGIPTTDETGFIVFERADSALLVPEGIAALDVKA